MTNSRALAKKRKEAKSPTRIVYCKSSKVLFMLVCTIFSGLVGPLFISRTDRLLIDYNFYTFTLQKQIFPKHDLYMSRTPQKANLNKSIGYDILTDSSSYSMDSFYQNRHHCFRIGFSSLLTPALTRVQKWCQHMSPSFGVIYDFAPKLSLVMIVSLKHLRARYPKRSLSHHERHMKLLFTLPEARL